MCDEDYALRPPRNSGRLTPRSSRSMATTRSLSKTHEELLQKEVNRLIGLTPSLMTHKEELYSYGSVGLLEAIQRFDPLRGSTFKTYATYRVRGAILDGIRSLGFYGRTGYDQLKQIARLHFANTPAPSSIAIHQLNQHVQKSEHEDTHFKHKSSSGDMSIPTQEHIES